MKYVSVITDYTYLLWQQELQIFNFKKLGLVDDLVVVILIEPGESPSKHAQKIRSMCETHMFMNDQENRSYIPSNKPYGLMKLLKYKPEYGKSVFLLDSDVILKEKLDFSAMPEPGITYLSDTRGYIGYCYLSANLSDLEIANAGKIIGVTLENIKEIDSNSGGAQYYFKNITPDFCFKAANDSINLHSYLSGLKKADGNHKVQIWTAEMWSWLWNASLVSKVSITKEMDFLWPGANINAWNGHHKILHMAGVLSSDDAKGIFRKSKYPGTIPWQDPSWEIGLKPNNCAWKYVELIMEYAESERK